MSLRDTVTTPRLDLRPPRPDDQPALDAIHADPAVMAHFRSTLDPAGSAAFMAAAAAHRARHGFGFWVVERRAEPGAIGLVGLLVPTFRAPFTPCVEVSWRLGRTHWGAGYAREAAEACLGFGFGDLGLAEIVAFTPPANVRSWRLMQRLGMTRDPADDFDHPNLPDHHALRRHLLYRRTAAAWRRSEPG